MLILISLPFSRLTIVLQKWFSIQIVGLIIILSYLNIFPVLTLLWSGFSGFGKEALNFWYKGFLKLFAFSLLLQLLISSSFTLLTILFSDILYNFAKKIYMLVFCTLFTAVIIISLFIPLIINGKNDNKAINYLVNNIADLNVIKQENPKLFDYCNDPDLEQFYDFRNWWTDKELLKENFDIYKNELNNEKFCFLFKETDIYQLHTILNSSDENIENTFLTKDITLEGIDVGDTDFTPFAVKTVLDLYKKEFNTISLKSIDNPNYFFEKSKQAYIVNRSDFTTTENKILNLSKIFSKEKSNSTLVEANTRIFVKSLAMQYTKKYFIKESSPYSLDAKVVESENKIKSILKNKNKQSFYIVDCPIFQNLFSLLQWQYKITKLANFFEQSTGLETEIIKKTDLYFERLKINHYSNIIMQFF